MYDAYAFVHVHKYELKQDGNPPIQGGAVMLLFCSLHHSHITLSHWCEGVGEEGLPGIDGHGSAAETQQQSIACIIDSGFEPQLKWILTISYTTYSLHAAVNLTSIYHSYSYRSQNTLYTMKLRMLHM